MGAVLVMIAVRNGGTGDGRWVLAGSGAAFLALVLLANVANPEAVVVRHNIDRALAGAELDIAYLGLLSDDAVPTLVHVVTDPEIGEDLRVAVMDAIKCVDEHDGVANLNVAVARAAEARDEVCRI
jgi:hypothetical protein